MIGTPLRRGWTTGACATAAPKAALTALITGHFPDPVSITLPGGQTPSFPLATEHHGQARASAGIIKDAGDDPDVTHGATLISTVWRGDAGSGVTFLAGEGVGRVTQPGLPIEVGEPAINPVPRQMMRETVQEIGTLHGVNPDFVIEISVPNGARIAERTWNPRLGILGGISILGTTGIVKPFSCSAWIHSIRRGIDVARATGTRHVLGATGSTSEKAARRCYDFADIALLDMGDFAGGLLKYLRDHPVGRLTIAGGFAKMTKLAQGALDLHSARSTVDLTDLAELAIRAGASGALAEKIIGANTALEALQSARAEAVPLPQLVAERARQQALSVLREASVDVEVMIVARDGEILARCNPFDG